MKPVNLIFFVFMLVICNPDLLAQIPDGGGHYEQTKSICISETQRLEIERTIKINRAYLLSHGLMRPPKKTRNLSLGWPLQQAAGFNYCSFYAISNFVDHNIGYPNQVLDFNCGSRTYDLANGYNHGGVDIFLWPFDWNMVNDQQVEVIAAAPGVIVGKFDGNTDMNCDFSNPNWNAIYIEHIDGTVAWYGHMKNGSLNNKTIGASIVLGEKLGIVASSGSSTGPHLHFELHDIAGNVIDPFAGPCNAAGTNLWAVPKSYYEPTINTAFTHSEAPIFNPCPNTHITNLKDTFYASDDIYFAGYFHDQLINSNATYTVKRPDNSTFATWTHMPPLYYEASYWYWKYAIPAAPMYGLWTFSIEMNGQVCSHAFVVENPAAVDISDLNKIADEMIILPNPAIDAVTVRGAKDQIEIYDIQGKFIGSYLSTSLISIKSYQNGIYFVKSGNKVKKLVVSR